MLDAISRAIVRTQTARMEELRAKAEAAEAEVRTTKKEVARHQAEGNAARRALAAHEAALEALATKRSDVLEAATMEQVHLPLSLLRNYSACLSAIACGIRSFELLPVARAVSASLLCRSLISHLVVIRCLGVQWNARSQVGKGVASRWLKTSSHGAGGAAAQGRPSASHG